MQKISSKSTKAQIMKAYNELLRAYKALESTAKAKSAAPTSADKADEPSGDVSIADIIEALAGLSTNFSDATRTLQQKLTTEAVSLNELREAIAGHIDHLKELHGIEATDETLNELLKGYSETSKAGEEELRRKKSELRDELDEKRQAWKKEQDEHSRA
ncbi:MAG TPA: hypothetical protein ENJ18_14050, partial [Nannocystis exedens]|nr:hypothetical protein [Nannocystis exedens]